MKPNHHWSIHTPDQILDFGPFYEFWTFLTERLNKILKNVNNNNWGGGQLEICMLRAFGRDSQFETMVCNPSIIFPVHIYVYLRQKKFNLHQITPPSFPSSIACLKQMPKTGEQYNQQVQMICQLMLTVSVIASFSP
jgi:hypothetical protein